MTESGEAMPSSMPIWSVIRTRSRWEKKVAQLLLQKGIEIFCPVCEVRRKWSDRIKVVQQPLMPTLIFAKVNDSQRAIVRKTPGVINFVISDCKPVILKDKTIQKIRQFQETYPYLEVKPATEQEKQTASITNNPGNFYVDGLGLFLVGYSQS